MTFYNRKGEPIVTYLVMYDKQDKCFYFQSSKDIVLKNEVTFNYSFMQFKGFDALMDITSKYTDKLRWYVEESTRYIVWLDKLYETVTIDKIFSVRKVKGMTGFNLFLFDNAFVIPKHGFTWDRWVKFVNCYVDGEVDIFNLFQFNGFNGTFTTITTQGTFILDPIEKKQLDKGVWYITCDDTCTKKIFWEKGDTKAMFLGLDYWKNRAKSL